MTSTSIKYWDVKPEPKTEYELWVRWRAHMSAKLRSLNAKTKRIEVRYE